MKKRNIFTRPVTFLIMAVLAATAFAKGDLRDWLYIGAFAVSLLWLLIALIWRNACKMRRTFHGKPKRLRVKRNKSASAEFLAPDESDPMSAALLRHVNHRVSAYLKSAYPDAAWEWVSEEPERVATEGGTGRIRLFNVSDFNYADVSFDPMARISCDFLRLVPHADLQTASGVSAEDVRTGQPVDPAVWYDLQGKAVLESCIADLNSHGFSMLTIKESGDVCVKQGGQEIRRQTLNHFPARQLWPALAQVLGQAGWSAAVLDTGLAVSW